MVHEALQHLGEQGIQRHFATDAERQIADDGHGMILVHNRTPLHKMAPLWNWG